MHPKYIIRVIKVTEVENREGMMMRGSYMEEDQRALFSDEMTPDETIEVLNLLHNLTRQSKETA